MRHICFIDCNIPYLADALAPISDVHEFEGRSITQSDLRNCTALFVRSITKVNAQLLKNTPVEFVATATSGSDHIDENYLKSRGITFSSAIGSNSNSVAEYVVFSILYWAKQRNFTLSGKFLGIVGYGNIGRKVAHYAKNLLQMEVIVNDPPLNDVGFVFEPQAHFVQLNELCSRADIITNHVPLHDGLHPTFHLFDEKRIALMKNDCLFIHASRGDIVEENALLRRLQHQNIDAVLDVFSNEPYINSELVAYCLLATPHIAGYSFDAKLNGARIVADAFCKHAKLSIFAFPKIEAEIVADSSIGLLTALMASRRLNDDSIIFKSAMRLPKVERAALFDAMRSNYPTRREVLH